MRKKHCFIALFILAIFLPASLLPQDACAATTFIKNGAINYQAELILMMILRL